MPLPYRSTFLAVCALLGACSSVHPAQPRAFEGPMIAPSGIEGVAFRFDREGTARLVEAREDVRWPLPPGAGRPASVACDTSTGLAVVACEGALGLVRLGFETEPEWTLPAPWDEVPGALAACGETAAYLIGKRVTLVDLQNRGAAEDFTELDLRTLDLPSTRPLLAIPSRARPREALTVVGWKGGARHGAVHVTSLVRGPAGWGVATSQRVDGYTYLHVCSANGSELVLAGIHEEQDRSSAVGGGFATLRQTLLVDHVDLESLEVRRLVRADRHALDTRVTGVAPGDDLVAVTRSDGALTVYDTNTGAVRTTQRFGTVPSAAWTAPRQLLVSADTLETLEL